MLKTLKIKLKVKKTKHFAPADIYKYIYTFKKTNLNLVIFKNKVLFNIIQYYFKIQIKSKVRNLIKIY